VLRHVGLSRSTYYYILKRPEKGSTRRGGRTKPGWSATVDGVRMADTEIKKCLIKLIEGDGFYYGYRKLTWALRRGFNLVINKKKVYRLCKELNALRPERKRRAKYPRRPAKKLVVTGPNQLWETDIKYGYVGGEDRFFQIASIIDVYDRVVVGMHIGLECVGRDVVRMLRKALESRGISGKGLILRSDNGPQFKSSLTQKACRALGVTQEFIPINTPNLNAYIESYHSILENECLSDFDFRAYVDALTHIRRYVEFHNTRRLHSSCGYRPPPAYHQAILSKSVEGAAMRA
jgi:putative transposase